METYTDSEKVPVAAALAKLPEFGNSENGNKHTGKYTGFLVQVSQSVSMPVTSSVALNGDKTPVNIDQNHCLSPFVILGHEQSNGGEGGIRTPVGRLTGLHDPLRQQGTEHDNRLCLQGV
jgi:hypothetical protein